MKEKERYIFGQRILYDNEKEVVCFDGFNLDEFMGIITNILNKQDKENQQLKQQLHDLPKEIVGEIRTHFLYGVDGDTTGIDIILDSILKKFGGEDE